MDLPAHIRDQLVDIDQLTEALSKRPPHVQRLRVAVQLRPHVPNIPDLLSVVHLGGAGIHLKALLQLVQHHLFCRLIGVQLQAEILDSQGGKALLHHLQGGHFLRHKQNRLLLRQGVGDHGGDRLGFSGSRRAVEHKAHPAGRHIDRPELGGVHRDREERFLRVHALRDGAVPVHRPLDEAAHNLILFQKITLIVDVVPHHELGK